jgi:choice-of-anchor A domain-containing protein
MQFKMTKTICLALLLLPFCARANQLTLGAAAGYNVFVFSDFTGSSDAQGKVAVGGNFTPGGSGFTVAQNYAGQTTGYDLVVGGNFTETGNSVGGGNIYVGGNMNWSDPTIPNNAYVDGNFVNNTNGGSAGGKVYYGGTFSSGDAIAHQQQAASSMPLPISFSGAQTSLDSLATSLAGYSPNGAVVHSYSNYTLTGTDANLNVFDLTDSSYSSGSITITAPAGSTVIVNVAGSADSFSNGQIVLNGVSASDVIWNFDSASSLTFGSYGFYGSILAPFANFSGSWGQINGQIIAETISGTTQFNETLFSGNLGSGGLSQTSGQGSVPEPATWLLLTTAGVALACFRRTHQRSR